MSNLKAGDRVVVIESFWPELYGATGTVIGPNPDNTDKLLVDMDAFDFRTEGYLNKELSALPCHLRKIDDDHDEIPSNIRALFDDKCDESLPTPARVRHE